MLLSIIIPVYNEEKTIVKIIQKIKLVKWPQSLSTEILVVDDGSTDSTAQRLAQVRDIKVIRQSHQGKGSAVRTALSVVKGQYCIIQDADLEYDPQEIVKLVLVAKTDTLPVVYGSRNLQVNPRSTILFFWGGVILSKLTNWLYGSSLTDESTGYKLIQTALMKDLHLSSQGFDFCPELTAKILKRHILIKEVPISYSPRSFQEGKKIKVSDGIWAIWTLLRYKFIN